MARNAHLVALICGGMLLTGCVTQEKYSALKLDRDALAEQLAKAQSDANGARSEADSYKGQLASLMQNGGNSTALLANLQQQNAALQAQYDELMNKYSDSMNRPGFTALPQELSNTLSQFASQNPDLVDFDAARGIVKFKSDVTFATGEATLTPKAKEAIARFATILNSTAASGYELMVAGHTDNTRVVNQRTISAGHKDNWYLSAHRAISVGEDLVAQRINPQRIAVVGYADQRPIASNGSDAGKSQNRRVEVLILPSTVKGGNFANTPGKKNLNKDSANVESKPVLNK